METGSRTPERKGSLKLILEDLGLLIERSVAFPHEVVVMQTKHGLDCHSASDWNAGHMHCSNQTQGPPSAWFHIYEISQNHGVEDMGSRLVTAQGWGQSGDRALLLMKCMTLRGGVTGNTIIKIHWLRVIQY